MIFIDKYNLLISINIYFYITINNYMHVGFLSKVFYYVEVRSKNCCFQHRDLVEIDFIAISSSKCNRQ
jgi:hypothetical protein